MRKDLITVPLDFRRGINDQAEEASLDECAEALNVWAPDGRLIARPGYIGLTQIAIDSASLSGSRFERFDTSASSYAAQPIDINGIAARISDPDGTITQEGDWLYLGASSPFGSCSITSLASSALSTDTRFVLQYWNGVKWKGLSATSADSSYDVSVKFLEGQSSTSDWLFFAEPKDWALTTVNSNERYWLRMMPLGVNPSYGGPKFLTSIASWVGSDVRGLFSIEFSSNTRTSVVYDDPFLATPGVKTVDSIVGFTRTDLGDLKTSGYLQQEPATIAVVPQFDEAFISYGYATSRVTADGNGEQAEATVEGNPELVGEGAPFDKNYIVQDTAWPRAKYTTFFKGLNWAANLEGRPFAIKWSAPAPYHKVWPGLSEEDLMEDDNSPITGLKALGEHMIVFKQDSIWQLVDAGIDGFGLQQFVPRRVVAGVGCVSNSSIVQVRGTLMFLAEDGVYAFDGTPNIRKLSDRIETTVRAIVPSKRTQCTAAKWKTRSLYMLAVPTQGDGTNDKILVYDYKNDAWWIWDDMDAQFWLNKEGAYDNEEIYFADSNGAIFQFNVGRTSHGKAITSSVTSHRIGYRDYKTLRLQDISGISTNQSKQVSVEVLRNDATSGTSTAMVFTDPNEKSWAQLDWTSGTGSWYPQRRRAERVGFRETADWYQLKLTHNTKEQVFKLTEIRPSFKQFGWR